MSDPDAEPKTTFEVTLSCNTTAVSGKSVYETLAYVDQNERDDDGNLIPGYNYEVSYITGYVNITPRPIVITPDSNQGFQYGDYHDTLIPAITYTDSIKVGTGIEEVYGLVNGGSDGSQVCLTNIDYYNYDSGTCFMVNDRIVTYDSRNSKTTSSYNASLVDSDRGLLSENQATYVFGDTYINESSSRSALGRVNATTGSTEQRYNRNVGTYQITIGDLKDQSGNYTVSFSSTVVT